MKLLMLIAALGMVMSAGALGAEEGWRPLFNGKNMDGWKMTGPGQFKVEDRALTTYGGMGLLWYEKEKLGNCEIRVVYRTSKPSDNSGVFIRINGEPKDPWFAVHNGYEVQIDDHGDSWHRTGALYSLTEVKEKVEAKAEEWNTMLIRLEGDRTIVHVNGTLVTDYKEGQAVPPKKKYYEPDRGARPVEGYIGLQNHDNNSKVQFKEISVRPLE